MKVLNDLEFSGNIESMAVVTRDGHLIKGDPENCNMINLAAMAATLMGVAEVVLSDLGKGFPKKVIVETDRSSMIVKGSGPRALVTAVMEPGADMKSVMEEIEKVTRKIKSIYES